MILIFDTETSGKFDDRRPIDHPEQPRLVSLAAVAYTDDGQREIHSSQYIVRPEGFIISEEVSKVHGITHEFATQHGIECKAVLSIFMHLYWASRLSMTFNWNFDDKMVRRECAVQGIDPYWLDRSKGRCVMLAASAAMKLPNQYGYESYAWPKLDQAYEWFFGQKMEGAHNSLVDTRCAAWLAFGMRDRGYWDMETAA